MAMAITIAITLDSLNLNLGMVLFVGALLELE